METSRYADDESKAKKEFGKKKDGKKDKKDKGYKMFEEEDSEEEVLVSKENRTPMKLKKHSKPSFKFPKKDKPIKPKEKEKDKEEKRKDEKEKKKEEKLKSKKKKLGVSENVQQKADESPIFGIPLALAVQRNPSHDSLLLPAVFRECVDYIEEYGLTCEGIYRISGVKSKVQALKEAYNKGIPVYVKEYEPSVVASLMKQFLRELPEPVLTTEFTPKFEQASTIKNVKQKVEEFQKLIEKLPTPNRLLLSWTIVHMTHVISREKQNKMSLQNVSIVLSPTMQISHRVLNVFFTFSKILFRDTVIKKYVPPLKPVTSRWSLDLPDSPNSLEDELRKQESLLDGLHKDLMKVKDTNKEEQLWEVQRVVTGLKRKLKQMKKTQEMGRSPKLHKPMPPQNLDLKLKHEVDARLQPREKQSKGYAPQPPRMKPITKENEDITARRGQTPPPGKDDIQPAVKPVDKARTAGTKHGMDFGDMEVDSSAQSQRQQTDRREQVSKTVEDLDIEVHPEDEEGDAKISAKSEDSHSKEDKVKQGELNKSNEEISENQDDLESKQKDLDTSQDKISSEEIEDSKTGNKSEADVERKQLETETGEEKKLATDHSEKQEVVETMVQVKSEEEVLKTGEVASEVSEKVEEVTIIRKKSHSSNEDITEERPAHRKSNIEVIIVPKRSSIAEGKVVLPVVEMPDVDKPTEPQAVRQKDIHLMSEKFNQLELPDAGSSRSVTVPPNSAKQEVNEQAVGSSMEQHTEGGVEPEKLAAALSELVTQEEVEEEDLNEQVMSEFVHDFGIEKSESPEQDEEYLEMLQQHQALMLEEEELLAIGDELHQKIETEQSEIERLREEIMEIQMMREDIYSSDDNSSVTSTSSEESLDGEEMQELLARLSKENELLESQNTDLTEKIHQERQVCLEVKVQIRMLQQKHLESSMNNQLDLLL